MNENLTRRPYTAPLGLRRRIDLALTLYGEDWVPLVVVPGRQAAQDLQHLIYKGIVYRGTGGDQVAYRLAARARRLLGVTTDPRIYEAVSTFRADSALRHLLNGPMNMTSLVKAVWQDIEMPLGTALQQLSALGLIASEQGATGEKVLSLTDLAVRFYAADAKRAKKRHRAPVPVSAS